MGTSPYCCTILPHVVPGVASNVTSVIPFTRGCGQWRLSPSDLQIRRRFGEDRALPDNSARIESARSEFQFQRSPSAVKRYQRLAQLVATRLAQLKIMPRCKLRETQVRHRTRVPARA